MIWRVSYDDADDWIYVRCNGREEWTKRVESSGDLGRIARHARRKDAEATFEFTEKAEQFRAAVLGE